MNDNYICMWEKHPDEEIKYKFLGYETLAKKCDYLVVDDGHYEIDMLHRLVEKNVCKYIYIFNNSSKYASNKYDVSTRYWTYEVKLLPHPTKRYNGCMYFDNDYSIEYAIKELKQLIKESQDKLVKDIKINWCKYNLKTSSPVNKHLRVEDVKVLEELKDE